MPDADLEQLLRALERLLGVDDRRLRDREVGALQIGIEREQRRAFLDAIALAHHHGFDPALLVGADEDQIGLDPALEFVLGLLAAGREQQCRADQRHADAIR